MNFILFAKNHEYYAVYGQFPTSALEMKYLSAHFSGNRCLEHEPCILVYSVLVRNPEICFLILHFISLYNEDIYFYVTKTKLCHATCTHASSRAVASAPF